MIATDAKILLGGYDISADANQVVTSRGFTQEPNSRFGNSTEVFANGVRKTGVTAMGFYRAALDAVLRTKFDAADSLISVFGVATTVGDRGESIRAHVGEYAPLPDAVWGKSLAFNFRAYGRTVNYGARYLASGLKVASGAGTALQIVGGVPAGKKLYSGLHVVSAAGVVPTLDVVVQSAPTEDFAAPTTRVTHAQKTVIGDSLPAGVSGAITDEYYRLAWTLGGVGPQFNIFGWLAIQR